MFKATLADVALLRDSISSIAELIGEGVFKVTKDGISLIAADRAMVAVVDFTIAAKAFESFEADKEESIGINITNLLSVLKRAGAGDKLTLALKDAKLEVVLQGASRRRFLLPLLDIRQEEVPPIDQLEFNSCIEVKPDVLQSGIDDAEIIADSVVFDVSANRFGMLAEGDVSKTELEMEKGNEALVKLEMKAGSNSNVKARYALDYLKKMVKAAKIAESVVLEYGQDYPMRLGFKAGDKVRLQFVLAPRVTEK